MALSNFDLTLKSGSFCLCLEQILEFVRQERQKRLTLQETSTLNLGLRCHQGHCTEIPTVNVDESC